MNETTKNLAIALERYIGKFGDCGDVYYQAKKAMDNYRAEQEKPNNEIKLLNTTDAMVWATEFNKIYPMILKDGEGVTDSKEVLLTWFANAIMAGYDHARRKYEPKNELVELDEEKLSIILQSNIPLFTPISLEEVRKLRDCLLKTFGTKRVSVEDIYNTILENFYPATYWTNGLGDKLAKAVHRLIYGGGE